MREVVKKMKECWQIEGKQTIWQHGWAVWRETEKIIKVLEGGVNDSNLPEWMLENREFILSSLVSRRELKLYTVMHDCGKPYCKPDS